MPIESVAIPITEKDQARFLDRVAFAGPDDCWPWTGPISAKGYGLFKLYVRGVGTKMYRAHRVAWTIANGPVPADKLILHSPKCTTRACCNPAHLRTGTQADNMADRWEAETRKPTRPMTRQTIFGPITKEQQDAYAKGLVGKYPDGMIPYHALGPSLPWGHAKSLPPIPDDDPIPRQLYDLVTQEQQ